MSTGRFEHFEKNNVISMERERADGGNNSFMTVENDKEEDYYYTTPVSQRQNQPNINQHQNLEAKIKTRSMGPEGRSASSSPKTILQQNLLYSSYQNEISIVICGAGGIFGENII